MTFLFRKAVLGFIVSCALCGATAGVVSAQHGRGETQTAKRAERDFGPVVKAYLSYLDNEVEVVDDRASRHEISPAYYKRNANRVRALRRIALQLAEQTEADFIPELVAVASDEFHTLFAPPPLVNELQSSEIYQDIYRYIGSAQSGGMTFYIFARLEQYELEEARRKRQAATEVKPEAAGDNAPNAPEVIVAPGERATHPPARNQTKKP